MPDDNKSRPPPAGHIERADPSGSLRSSIEDGTLLKDPLARSFLADLGAPSDVLDRMVALSDELSSLVTGYERWAPLTQIGWAITDLASPQVYDQAAELLSAGDQETAEEVLEDYWNEPGRLESVALRVLRLATHSEIRIRAGRRRPQLLELAVADHRSGRYHASSRVWRGSHPFGRGLHLVIERKAAQSHCQRLVQRLRRRSASLATPFLGGGGPEA